MLERILYALAAAATIATFLLEAWRTWKDERKRKRADDKVKMSGR